MDLHSHLIPDIDDGVKTWDESLEILSQLCKLGYKKIITTPHIIQNYYPNTPDKIRAGVAKLNELLAENNISMSIEAGAEYYLDDVFAKQVETKEDLLSFGNGYILIETPFMNKPLFLEEIVFTLQANGYKPILAHPERYAYLQNNKELIHSLNFLGLFMQINISSLTGYYSKEAQKTARYLIDTSQVHFLASDIHNHKHLAEVKKAIKSKLFQRCRQLPLLNSTL
ncbi:tyrosine-protein phosphatase [Reichenbachiella sp.]|uniref:tyrosine-protein phosphatase n=1 Tax=Reichenbachiella sp. TaxID=2184521 RepID=UPI003B5CDEAA